MNYPLISEYIDAIKSSEDNLNQLNYLRPVFDDDGNPILSSGNFAVVFKMTDGKKNYAIKCFIKDQEDRTERYKLISDYLKSIESEYVVSVKYIENELFVDTKQTDVSEFPVLLMDWIEGQTLSSYLNDAYNKACSYWSTSGDGEDVYYELTRLLNNFLRMASWLLHQTFAHGDLKPDNIIINQNGTCVLIDYDGMYVPTMAGMQNVGMGTVNFRYPFNAYPKFDKHIDNYAIALIALSLQAFVIDVCKVSDCVDYCIIKENDVTKLDEISFLHEKEFISDNNFKELFALYLHTLAHNQLSSLYFDESISNILIPNDLDVYDTTAHEDDLNYCWEDDYGVKYSFDGRRVLKASSQLKGKDYVIREGAVIICDQAFQNINVNSIKLPSSVISIGNLAFANNDNMVSCNIPSSVRYINDNNPWGGCFNIKRMECNSPYYVLDNGILYTSDYYTAIGLIYWQSTVKIDVRTRKIAGNAFWSFRKEAWYFLKSIELTNVNDIGTAAFMGCRGATFEIEHSPSQLGKNAFLGCENLIHANIEHVNVLEEKAFASCTNLTSVKFSKRLQIISDNAFYRCVNLTEINVPKSCQYISSSAFSKCNALININVEQNNKYYISEDGVLYNNKKTSILKYPEGKKDCYFDLPESITDINDECFISNRYIGKIFSKGQISSCGKKVVNDCINLSEVNINVNANIDSESINDLALSVTSLISNKDFNINYAIEILTMAAERDQSHSQYLLALLYHDSKYGFDSVDKYIYWLKRAAANNQRKAQAKLARELLIGKNMAIDVLQAYNIATELDSLGENVAKECNGSFYSVLGFIYSYDVNHKDLLKAYEYNEKGAEYDDGLSLFELGKSYENGIVVAKDLDKAFSYYSRAAEKGVTGAKEAARRLDSSGLLSF